MSKVAGIHNKSPESYPEPKPASVILETLSKVNLTPVTLGADSFTSLMGGAGPIMFTPSVAAKAVILFSGFLQAATGGSQIVTIAIVVNTVQVTTVQVEVPAAVSEPVPFSIVFEEGLVGGAPVTIDVQGETNSGTVSASNGSLVVIVTTN